MTDLNLIDGIERNRLHPTKFKIPSSEEIDLVGVGDYIKIGVEFVDPSSDDGVSGERFWCKVTKRGTNGFEAIIDNDLVCSGLHGLDFNKTVRVERRHVLSIMMVGRPVRPSDDALLREIDALMAATQTRH